MNPGVVSTRTAWFVSGAIILVALGALIIGGLGGIAVRTYALEAPNQFPLVTLLPGHTVCEGPVSSSRPFRSVVIWGGALGDHATLRLTASTPGRATASGTTWARNIEEEQRITLNATIAGGTPVRVCVTDEQGHFSIAGSPAVRPGIVRTGKPAGQEFSLLLLSGERSLFSALPIAFSRAALFRPAWVGTWTFWALVCGLLATFALALVAIADVIGDEAETNLRESRLSPPRVGRAGS